jgi:AraC family transcriptional regulator, ethanolamine operon transcriptional activator
MGPNLHFFEDFHIHGASASEWNQRYLQMSPGAMRSSLAEWSAGKAHVFRKWMSKQVVQQGGLPAGQICFALLDGDPAGGMRVQGREFRAGDLLVLRGGEDFEFQRPAGAELLSVTFGADAFSAFLDRSRVPAAARNSLRHPILKPEAATFDALRLALRLRLSPVGTPGPDELMDAVREALLDATLLPAPRAAAIAAARAVQSCHEIVATELFDQPMRIDELCRRLDTSRRTLQDSFQRVTGTRPLAYLRNIRLNLVRRRLLSSPAGALSVSEAASEAGFDHFGHFAGEYKALFGELPSRTRRAG